MNKVLAEQVTEVKAHHFAAEASELGWKPGYVPCKVETNIGNGLPLMLEELDYEKGYFTYNQVAGCITLRVYND